MPSNVSEGGGTEQRRLKALLILKGKEVRKRVGAKSWWQRREVKKSY